MTVFKKCNTKFPILNESNQISCLISLHVFDIKFIQCAIFTEAITYEMSEKKNYLPEMFFFLISNK